MRPGLWAALLPGVLCSTLLLTSRSAAEEQVRLPFVRPVITIIIDDLGNNDGEGARTVALPGPVACAVLPHTPYGRAVAESAHTVGKEVLLHLPLEALSNNDLLGEGAIKLDDSAATVARVLHENLQAVPHVAGINNHMGSLLTQHPGHMRWLMEALQNSGQLFFVDSVTTRHTVAFKLAREYALPAVKRDIFLDRSRDRHAIMRQFEKLIARANAKGYATAIGHPFPETLDVLEEQLPRLYERGITLIGVSDMIRQQGALRRHARQMVKKSAPASGGPVVAVGPVAVPQLQESP